MNAQRGREKPESGCNTETISHAPGAFDRGGVLGNLAGLNQAQRRINVNPYGVQSAYFVIAASFESARIETRSQLVVFGISFVVRGLDAARPSSEPFIMATKIKDCGRLADLAEVDSISKCEILGFIGV